MRTTEQGLTKEQGLLKALDIAKSNAVMCVDQVDAHDSKRVALAAYLVNTLDTMREEGITYYREHAVEHFLDVATTRIDLKK